MAASGQQKNIKLNKPELYDMTVDVGESYDQATDHQAVVKALTERIIAALRTFPQEIQKANADLLGASAPPSR